MYKPALEFAMDISGMTMLSRAMDDSRSSISMFDMSFLLLSIGSNEASVSVRNSSNRLAICEELCKMEGIKEARLSDKTCRTSGAYVSRYSDNVFTREDKAILLAAGRLSPSSTFSSSQTARRNMTKAARVASISSLDWLFCS
jgi:hypothetical protein